jgi:hypothetical protein
MIARQANQILFLYISALLNFLEVGLVTSIVEEQSLHHPKVNSLTPAAVACHGERGNGRNTLFFISS